MTIAFCKKSKKYDEEYVVLVLPNLDSKDCIKQYSSTDINADKPSVGDFVIVNGKLYKVCQIAFNYDKKILYVIVEDVDECVIEV